MAKPINITIKGNEVLGIDAPTVEDLLFQIQDLVSVFHGVEDALSENSELEIDWRITNARKNSPLTFEVTPFPRNHAMNIDRRVTEVVSATANGFYALANSQERPMYFSDNLIKRVERIYERVANGLNQTIVDLSEYEDLPEINVSRNDAQSALNKLYLLKNPDPIPYKELGSVEGYIAKIELDGHQRPIVWLRSRIDGQVMKCIAKERGLDRIGHYEVAEILKGMRVQFFGTIHYKDIDRINTVEVDDIHLFSPDDDLPDIYDIVDPEFTNGVEACQYLRNLRENE